jgi:hypothetical protein
LAGQEREKGNRDKAKAAARRTTAASRRIMGTSGRKSAGRKGEYSRRKSPDEWIMRPNRAFGQLLRHEFEPEEGGVSDE